MLSIGAKLKSFDSPESTINGGLARGLSSLLAGVSRTGVLVWVPPEVCGPSHADFETRRPASAIEPTRKPQQGHGGRR